MARFMSARKTVIAAITGAALLGGGAAFAYPANTPLSVTATAAPATDAQHQGQIAVMVSLQNSNPGCSTKISIGSGGGSITVDPGVTTATLYLPAGSTGRYDVRARTEQCFKGQKEHASSRFVISNATTTGPGTGTAGSTYRADAEGFAPGTDVTVTATLVGSNPLIQVSDSDTANSKGEAKVHFKFPKGRTGTYSITTTVSPAGPTSAPYNVTVSQ